MVARDGLAPLPPGWDRGARGDDLDVARLPRGARRPGDRSGCGRRRGLVRRCCPDRPERAACAGACGAGPDAAPRRARAAAGAARRSPAWTAARSAGPSAGRCRRSGAGRGPATGPRATTRCSPPPTSVVGATRPRRRRRWPPAGSGARASRPACSPVPRRRSWSWGSDLARDPTAGPAGRPAATRCGRAPRVSRVENPPRSPGAPTASLHLPTSPSTLPQVDATWWRSPTVPCTATRTASSSAVAGDGVVTPLGGRRPTGRLVGSDDRLGAPGWTPGRRSRGWSCTTYGRRDVWRRPGPAGATPAVRPVALDRGRCLLRDREDALAVAPDRRARTRCGCSSPALLDVASRHRGAAARPAPRSSWCSRSSTFRVVPGEGAELSPDGDLRPDPVPGTGPATRSATSALRRPLGRPAVDRPVPARGRGGRDARARRRGALRCRRPAGLATRGRPGRYELRTCHLGERTVLHRGPVRAHRRRARARALTGSH